MAILPSRALRSASRLRSTASSGAVRALVPAATRRAYVTGSRQDNAKVETAIKLDKKDFADIPPPQMGGPSNTKVSPMAGTP